MEQGTLGQGWRVKRKPVPQAPEEGQSLPHVDNVPSPSHSQLRRHASHVNHSLALPEDDLIPLIQLEEYRGNTPSTRRAAADNDQAGDAPGSDDVSALSGTANYADPHQSPHSYTHSVRSSETVTIRERRNPEPEPPGDCFDLIPSNPQPWKTVILSWWEELVWCLVSIASVGALTGVLRHFDDKPLPQWPLGLTLNTVIALLATFARAAFIIPVSEGLSQLKWLWYRRERPLRDFQDFDAASRGVWGSIQLVKTTKGWSPSLLSMIVILTAILTSTLTQSTVTYPTRLTPTLPKPVIPRAVKLYSWSPNLYYYLHAELEFDASIQAGLSHSHDSEFPFDQPRCPTTECVWDVVSTLGVCVKTWNVTAFLNVTYGDGDSSHVLKFASLPNGAYSNLSILSSGMVSLNNGQQPMYTAFDESEIPKTRISEFSIIYSVHNQGVRAVEAMFYFCIQRYNVSVHNNIASRELIDATVDSGYFLFNITQTSSPINLTGLKVPGEPNTKFPYGGRVVPLLRDSLDHALNGTFSQISSPGSERGRAPSRFFSAFDEMYTPDTKHKMGDAVTNITNNVARSLSNSLHRLSTDPANVTGEAFITETYVKVRWAWLAFISSQIVLSTIVSAVTIIQARNAGLGIVKSSTLPAFFVIDTHDRELLENGKGLKKQQEEVDDLLKEGHGVGWKLGLTDHGWKLHSR